MSRERASHRVSKRVGGVKVHKRPGSRGLVEPLELSPGYHVDLLSMYHGGEKIWAEIEYLYNGKYYTGWVIVDALDPAPSLPHPQSLPPPPPDVSRWEEDGGAPRPDTLGAPLPRTEPPDHGASIWPLVLAAIAIAVVAAFAVFGL